MSDAPHRSAQQERRLQVLGFTLEVTPLGKRYWREPVTGRRISEPEAAHLLRQREEQTLREAGWEPVEVEEERFWRRPNSGYLYSQGAAFDMLRAGEEQGE